MIRTLKNALWNEKTFVTFADFLKLRYVQTYIPHFARHLIWLCCVFKEWKFTKRFPQIDR